MRGLLKLIRTFSGQETCEEGSFRVQSWNRLLAAKTQPLDYTPTTFAILARGIPQVG